MRLIKQEYNIIFAYEIEDPTLKNKINNYPDIAERIFTQSGFETSKHPYTIIYHENSKCIAELSDEIEVRSCLKKALQKLTEVTDLLEK